MDSLEIERKFLLGSIPEVLLKKASSEEIRQGYLIREDNRELRIRQKGPASYWMTLKQGSGLKRHEQECAISKEQFSMLWPLTEQRRIEKTRYLIPWGSLNLEIDIFGGALAPLIILEIEFADLAASRNFSVPAFAGREITEDPAYKNATLAICGLPENFAV